MLLFPMVLLSIGGFVASLLVHVLALLGRPNLNPFSAQTWLLHPGVFVVCLPAMLIGQRLSRGATTRTEMLNATLRGCPGWVKNGAYVLFAYAVINFLLFALQTTSYPRHELPEAVRLRGFSGHWMAFYYMSAAVLYSFITLDIEGRVSAGARRRPAQKER